MKLVCIGDSITFGFGVLKKHRWTYLLSQNMKIDVLNKGTNGDTTAGMLDRSYEDIILNKPNYAIIMGGTNDFFLNYNVKNVVQNINLICDECVKFNIRPIIGIPIKVCQEKAKKLWSSNIDYFKVNKNIEILKKEAQNLCLQNKYGYIDFCSFFEQTILNSEKEEKKYYCDGIHPTYEGHKLMFECAEKFLEQF